MQLEMNQNFDLATAVIVLVLLSTLSCTRGELYKSNTLQQRFENANLTTFRFQIKKVQTRELPDSAHHSNFETDTVTEDCPTWMYRTNSSSDCICGVDNHHTVKCDQETNRAYILDSYRMTFDEEHREVIVGASLYGIFTPNESYDIYHLVPMNRSQLNEAMCGHFNRKGRLCSECKNGYSPLVYSYNSHCKQCSVTESKHNIPKFIAVAFVPLTVFYFFVVIFKFKANSPKLHGFLLFAHFISAPSMLRVMMARGSTYHRSSVIKLPATLYGLWNLDFFRTLYPDMCLKVTTLQALALDYVIAFYPLLLMLLTVAAFKLHSQGYRIILLIWYRFQKCLSILKKDRSEKTSMIDVFATFLLLSYGRILSINYNLLIYTSIVNSRGEYVGRYLYNDPSYEFFSKEHLPYGILALFISTCFNILPLLLLFFYPMKWFQKCLNRFRLSHLALHTFVDSFAGYYKDGTEPGTRDCRYFAALYLLIRILFHTIFEATLTVMFCGTSGILITGVLMLYVLFQPYKAKYALYNKITITMLAMIIVILFGAVNVSVASNKMYQMRTFSIYLVAILVLLPQLYIIAVAIRWTGVCNIRKCRLLISKAVKLNIERENLSEESLLATASGENNNQTLYNTASLI